MFVLVAMVRSVVASTGSASTAASVVGAVRAVPLVIGRVVSLTWRGQWRTGVAIERVVRVETRVRVVSLGEC